MDNGRTTYYTGDYAYPCESYISALLNSFVVRKSLQKIANKYYSEEATKLHSASTLVTEQTFPQISRLYEMCCSRLHIQESLPLYVTGRLAGINALSIELNGEQMILLSRQAVAQLSNDELLFMLGHELGHCKYGHMVCHTVLGLIDDMNKASDILGPVITDMIEVPLVKWFHCSEFTADRAGLICCGSMQTAQEIFDKLGMNSFTPDAFKHYQELSTPHPMLQTRWEMLQKFANEINNPVQ